jgi:hypothetical protein
MGRSFFAISGVLLAASALLGVVAYVLLEVDPVPAIDPIHRYSDEFQDFLIMAVPAFFCFALILMVIAVLIPPKACSPRITLNAVNEPPRVNPVQPLIMRC